MSSLDEMKKQLDLSKIDTAIMELKYKIEERKEDIKRMEDHIELQEKRKKEILSS